MPSEMELLAARVRADAEALQARTAAEAAIPDEEEETEDMLECAECGDSHPAEEMELACNSRNQDVYVHPDCAGDDYCTASILQTRGLLGAQAYWYVTWSGRYAFTLAPADGGRLIGPRVHRATQVD